MATEETINSYWNYWCYYEEYVRNKVTGSSFLSKTGIFIPTISGSLRIGVKVTDINDTEESVTYYITALKPNVSRMSKDDYPLSAKIRLNAREIILSENETTIPITLSNWENPNDDGWETSTPISYGAMNDYSSVTYKETANADLSGLKVEIENLEAIVHNFFRGWSNGFLLTATKGYCELYGPSSLLSYMRPTLTVVQNVSNKLKTDLKLDVEIITESEVIGVCRDRNRNIITGYQCRITILNIDTYEIIGTGLSSAFDGSFSIPINVRVGSPVVVNFVEESQSLSGSEIIVARFPKSISSSSSSSSSRSSSSSSRSSSSSSRSSSSVSFSSSSGLPVRLEISTDNFTLRYAVIDASDGYGNGIKISGANVKLQNVTIYAPNGLAIDANVSYEMTNCILEGKTQDIDIAYYQTVTSKNNCFHHHSNNADNVGIGTLDDVDSIFNQDPLFNDAEGGDFTLQGSSPCVDQGFDLGLTEDINGIFVPHGTDADIGAYEFSSSSKSSSSSSLSLSSSSSSRSSSSSSSYSSSSSSYSSSSSSRSSSSSSSYSSSSSSSFSSSSSSSSISSSSSSNSLSSSSSSSFSSSSSSKSSSSESSSSSSCEFTYRLEIDTNNFKLQYVLIDASDYNRGVRISGTNVKLYNVTIYAPNGVAVNADESCEFINCIIEGKTQDIDIATGKTVTSKNNCFHHHSNETDNVGAGTLDDTDSIFNQDPLFANPGTDDFTLQSGSPCIDEGFDLGLTEDINGITVPSGIGVDVGAYESFSSSSLSSSSRSSSSSSKSSSSKSSSSSSSYSSSSSSRSSSSSSSSSG